MQIAMMHRCSDKALYISEYISSEYKFRLLQEQNANAVVAGTKPVEPMGGASSYSTAPVTGISCDLIDELPTMALPMPEMMLGGLFDGLDQESCDFLN